MPIEFPQLRFSTLAAESYAVLKQKILDLEFAPGAPVDEVQIASQMGISKTPVREAIARLAGEGLIVSSSGRKGRVAELSLQTIHDVFRVRMLLEPASIREICPHLTSNDLQDLRTLVSQASDSLSHNAMKGHIRSNNAFHSHLVAKSENPVLISIMNGLLQHAYRVSAAVFRIEQHSVQYNLPMRSKASHSAILDALAERDCNRAAEMMRLDIQLLLDAVSTPEMQRAFEDLSFSA